MGDGAGDGAGGNLGDGAGERGVFEKNVFGKIYENRGGTVRFALLRDPVILAAGNSVPFGILIF